MNIPDTILKLVEEAEKQAAIVKQKTADLSIAQLELIKREGDLAVAQEQYADAVEKVKDKATEEFESLPLKQRITKPDNFWNPVKAELQRIIREL